ncbi:MAG: DUF4097 family beta strand repeat protein [Bacteroidetes bacterium]|nr:DUF4097 family beta strand repeat protein [Bacteroidota bacterium]
MNNLIVFKHSLVVALIITTTTLFGQKKYVESFDASKDMIVKVNTSYTNVIFKTWNRNKVEVEAFIDDDSLSESEKQELFDDWKFNVLGNSKSVVVTSNEHGHWQGMNYSYDFDGMDFNYEFLAPILENIEIPEMPPLLEMPLMPEIFIEGLSEMHFDYEQFKENGEEYMELWESKFEKHFGKDFEEKMEAWGNKFSEQWNEKKGDSISAVIEARMKDWEEKHGEKMEHWAKKMEEKAVIWEKQAEEMEKKAKKFQYQYENEYIKLKKTGKVNRTIIIWMPKNTKTEINVRHGELKMADAFNVRATLNYSPFSANSIDGGLTLINASYAPVIVNFWKQGELIIKYVDNCNVNKIENIKLQANSSDVRIGNITNTAILYGSYGMLKIDNISNSFEKLKINLENADAIIKVPSSNFSFSFNGIKSTFKYPKYLDLEKSKDLSKSITINASYSNVTLQ